MANILGIKFDKEENYRKLTPFELAEHWPNDQIPQLGYVMADNRALLFANILDGNFGAKKIQDWQKAFDAMFNDSTAKNYLSEIIQFGGNETLHISYSTKTSNGEQVVSMFYFLREEDMYLFSCGCNLGDWKIVQPELHSIIKSLEFEIYEEIKVPE